MMTPLGVGAGAIGVFAPSSPFDADRFAMGLEILRGLGFALKLHPQLDARDGFLAGDDAARAGAFHDLLEDPDVGAIMAARGGYGVHRWLSRLDPALVRAHPKPVIGFSDVTALHIGLARAGLASIHGPVVTQLGDLDREDHRSLQAILQNPGAPLAYSADARLGPEGSVEGTLVGGCLSVLCPLLGTPHWSLPDDAILLLEEVGEAPYRLDRLLTHLLEARALEGVRAFVVGDLVGCEPVRDRDPPPRAVIAERLGPLGVPILLGLPFGHGRTNLPVLHGGRARVVGTRLEVRGA